MVTKLMPKELSYVDAAHYFFLSEYPFWEVFEERLGGAHRTWAVVYDDAEAASAAIGARAESPGIEYTVFARSQNMEDLMLTMCYCYVCGGVVYPDDMVSLEDEPCHLDCVRDQ